MRKSFITIAIVMALVVVVHARAGHAEAARCGARGGSLILVNNSNVLFAAQIATAINVSGGNTLVGNIGGGSITSGPATSTSIQTITANTNTTTATITGTGGTNTTNVTNTGNNVRICTSASN